MSRVERDLWRVVLRQTLTQPQRALSNARFLLAMRLGGFETASRRSTAYFNELYRSSSAEEAKRKAFGDGAEWAMAGERQAALDAWDEVGE